MGRHKKIWTAYLKDDFYGWVFTRNGEDLDSASVMLYVPEADRKIELILPREDAKKLGRYLYNRSRE